MAKVLVIGAAGFIGSNIVNWLMCQTEYDIVGIDNMSTFDNILNLQPNLKSKRFNFYIADIADVDICSKILKVERPDFIINTLCAKVNSVVGVIKTSLITFSKFITLLDYNQTITAEIPTIGLQICNIYGPRQHPSCLMPSIISGIIHESPINIAAVDSCEWLYVGDLFNAIMLLLHNGHGGVCYNLGVLKKISSQMLTNLVNKVSNVPCFINLQPDISNVVKSGVNIQATLDWRPEREFSEAFEHTMVWYYSSNWIFNSGN